MMVAPLPSLAAIANVNVPAGLTPIDIMVMLGLGAPRPPPRAVIFDGRRLLRLAIVVALGLLWIAWYRTYGANLLSVSSLGAF